MRICGKTDIGKRRSTNQDTFQYRKISDQFAWVIVCDGMGGANGGDIASQTAAEVMTEILERELQEQMSQDEIKNLMLQAVNEANTAVFSKSVDCLELRGMGTTVVLAVIQGQTLHTVHVGDSRAYLKSTARLEQVTEDHSFVQDLVNRGEITKEQARVHPQKNIITRSLGVHSMVETDYGKHAFSAGEVLVICSDGLSDYMSEEDLAVFISRSPEPEDLVDSLISFALDCGGNDNITVAAVYY